MNSLSVLGGLTFCLGLNYAFFEAPIKEPCTIRTVHDETATDSSYDSALTRSNPEISRRLQNEQNNGSLQLTDSFSLSESGYPGSDLPKHSADFESGSSYHTTSMLDPGHQGSSSSPLLFAVGDPNTEMCQHPIHEQPIGALIHPHDDSSMDDSSTCDGSATLNAQLNPPHSESSSLRVYLSSPTAPEVPIPSDSTSSQSHLSPRYATRTNGDDHLDEFDNSLPELLPNPTKEDMKTHKKKMNARSAKISRLRKNVHMQELEEQIVILGREKEEWRTKAHILRESLISHGIPHPDFD